MGINPSFWRGRNVFITGHSGFKGAWLGTLLAQYGAVLSGFSLDPPSYPNLFDAAELSVLFKRETRANIADFDSLKNAMECSAPSVLFHLAAQPLVLESYKNPVNTFQSNTIGTLNVLEAARFTSSLQHIIIVTTDKVYAESTNSCPHTEASRLGASDPYSASKVCAELLSKSYSDSFFGLNDSSIISTVRAGNVIGGGDWAKDRLIPDCIRAFSNQQTLLLRNPNAIRPWQHVLEPLLGYVLLAQSERCGVAQPENAWNFGPDSADSLSVISVTNIVKQLWGKGRVEYLECDSTTKEVDQLLINSDKAYEELGWIPKWNARQSIEKTVLWYKSVLSGADPRKQTENQVISFLEG